MQKQMDSKAATQHVRCAGCGTRGPRRVMVAKEEKFYCKHCAKAQQ